MNYILYKKSSKQIEEEVTKNFFAGKIAKGHHVRICEYYILDENDAPKDVWDLSLDELANFCFKGENFSILSFVNKTQTISDYSTLLYVQQKYKKYGHMVSDFIGKLEGNRLIADARKIATYKTLVEDELTTYDEVIRKYAEFEQQIAKKKKDASLTK